MRTTTHVAEDYGRVWEHKALSFVQGERMRSVLWYNHFASVRGIDIRKRVIALLDETSRAVGATRVAELGSGVGINVLALAVMNPAIAELRGVELTAEGVAASKKFFQNPPILELQYLTGENEKTIRERLKNRHIIFEQGDMCSLPWSDNSFDFVFSWVAFEQIPDAYDRAFREAARILDGYALFIESFGEAQNSFQQLHLQNMDYFRASYGVVCAAGLIPLSFTPFEISKIKYRNGVLLARRETKSKP